MTQAIDPQKLPEVLKHIAGMMTGAHVAAMVALGVRLGLYLSLKDAGPVTSDDLASKTGLPDRWLR